MARNNGLNGIEGRLVGWLVSYGLGEEGVSYEIRSGRSLISSEDVEANTTVVVKEGTISSPHLALKASEEHEVLVQDIFSGSGSYLIRNGESDETPIEGPVSLEHGDWIRVGDNTRFQVCLIDGASR